MLAENLYRVTAEIAAAARRSGRDPAEIRLLAVTKTVGLEQVREAAELGLRDFGENRLQDAKAKLEAFPNFSWHFIGHLQTNKVKEVLSGFTLIHSLDRLHLAEALQHWGEQLGRSAAVLVQVNVAREKGKFGLDPAALPDFLDEMRRFTRVQVQGLMTMAPWVDDPEEARPVFRALRQLQRDLAGPGPALEHLSMGMSNDYTVAVEEGATLIRLGTALFGPRS
ncbi:MAG: YggS family pyridoxal phosphate-dependent enzyme [Bacillota bacterium]